MAVCGQGLQWGVQSGRGSCNLRARCLCWLVSQLGLDHCLSSIVDAEELELRGDCSNGEAQGLFVHIPEKHINLIQLCRGEGVVEGCIGHRG